MNLPPSSAIDDDLLADLLAEDGFALLPAAASIAPRPAHSRVPATSAQARLWAVERMGESAGEFNLGLAVRFNAAIAPQAMQRALLALLRRHEGLCVRFADRDGILEQVFETPAEMPLPCHTVSAAALEPALQQQAAQLFQLERDLPIRAHLFQVEGEGSAAVLLLCFHHIVIDLWSVDIVLRELTALYALESGARAAPLPPSPLQFGDYALWLEAPQQRQQRAGMRQYWRQRLADLPVALELPFSAPRERAGDRCQRIPLVLDAALTAAVGRLALQARTTPFMVMLAAFNAVLMRFSGAEDIAMGVPISNRHRPQSQDIVGFLSETLVLRSDLAGDPDFATLLERLRVATLEDFRHQDLPLDEIVQIVNPERRRGVTPLFQTMFVFQTMPPLQAQAGAMRATGSALPMPAARADLVLELDAQPEQIAGAFEYRIGLIDPTLASAMAQAIPVLLQAALDNPRCALSALPLQPAAAGEAWLAAHNPPVPDSDGASLTSLFSQRARSKPQALALVAGARSVSYAELEQKSAALAAHLRHLGVTAGVPVAICLERSVELAIAVLGVLRAGGLFLPMDPEFPAERLAYMLRDSGAKLLIGRGTPDWIADDCAPAFIDCEQEWPPQAAPDDGNRPDSLAYILYTSGSTGQPKAVMGLHQGAVNRLRWMWQRYPFGADEFCCQKTAPTFVDFIWEFFGPLLAGVPSVILPRSVVVDPAALVAALQAHRVTRLVLVPSLLRAMLDHVPELGSALHALRHCTTSGEALASDLARRFLQCLPACRLLNLYGSSEVSADSTFHEVDAVDGKLVPIGKPIPGNLLAVLDRNGDPLPVGAAGELVIGGLGLARGYWGREDLSAERFVTLPPHIAGGRAFRSGDLGRWRPDGGIDYLGRLDRQIKIRGVRIDPNEVRAALMTYPGLSEVEIAARPLTPPLTPDSAAELELVAYVVTQTAPDEPALRHWLAQKLPAALQPSAYVFLERMPLNANGKVDVRALPPPWERKAPGQTPASAAPTLAPAFDAAVAPLTLEESLLADLWQQVLGTRPSDPHAGFFMSGGHSLSAVRLAAHIEKSFGVKFAVTAIFEAPTLREMTARIVAGRPGQRLPELVAAGPRRLARASFNQERLWFIEQTEGLHGAYNQLMVYRLRGEFDAERFQQAVNALVQRHEALRTRLVRRDGQLWQEIDEPAHCPVRRLDFSDRQDPEAKLSAFLQEQAATPFVLEREWPLRLALIALGAQQNVLAIAIHHTASDGWSGQVMVDELSQGYAGQALDNLPAPLQQSDFSQWQHAVLEQGLLQDQFAWWRQELQGAPAVLGLALSRMPQQRGYRLDTSALSLGRERTDALRQLARAEQSSVFALLLGVWGTVLARLGAEDEVVIGIPVSGRSQLALDGTIGFLSNTIPLRVNCGGAPDAGELARRVQHRVLAALQHQDLSFTQILEAAGSERVPNRLPLMQAMFVLSDLRPWQLALPGIESAMQIVPSAVARADLMLALRESDALIEGHIEFAADVIAPELATRIAEAFLRLLDAVLEQPRQAVTAHALQGPQALAQLARFAQSVQALACNLAADLAAEPVPGQRIDQLVWRSAAARPQAPALMTPERSMTYAELAHAAEHYAQHLLAAGVQAGDRVALIAERSIELIVALVAVSRVGAVFVPIDPAYPQPSILHMLDDAGVSAIVADRPLAGREVLALPISQPAQQAQANAPLPAIAAATEDTACIIFTSGSTGRPKGVAVAQRALCRLASAAGREFGIDGHSRILQLAAFGFDVATSDIVFALAAGACLCLAPREQILPGSPLAATLAALGITHLQIPASLLAATPVAPLPRLKTLIVGGERCPLSVAEAWGAGRQLFVAYGPTEATVTVSAARYDSAAPASIGKPLGDARLYVLDANGMPAPIGVPGELCIGGPVVSRGYVNHPDLTAQRFQPDPFSQVPGATLYRSGDRARWREDGALEFLGRMDRQFKLRGFRIEPGEVEAALLAQAGIVQALAMLRTEAGHPQLVAYVVSTGANFDARSLRNQLRANLPLQMVPDAVVRVERMPLTANGKIDLKALPLPQLGRSDMASAAGALRQAEALDETGRQVSALWSRILKLADIDPDANFFDIGGQSLLLVQMHDLLAQEFGVAVPISDLFRFPTVRSLSAHLAAHLAGQAEPALVQPAASAASAEGEDDIAVIGMACRFPGASDLEAFWQMLEQGREGLARLDADALLAAGRSPASLRDPALVPVAGVIDDADCFDAEFFGMGPRDALTLDPQHRVALECAWHAMEHAGYAPGSDAPAATRLVGVFVSVGVNTYLRGVLYPDGQLAEDADTYHALAGNDKDFAATRIAYHLDLKGPALAVQTACSSSLVAVDMACQALRGGRARMALAGGVALHFPQGGGYRHEPGMILSPDGHCRAFSADAQGTVPGSGAGMVLLKPLSSALADGDHVLAVIRGSAVNNDGALKVGYTAPGVDGQAEVIAAALQAARLQAGQIDYIEAHGTGTALGDPVEVAALTRVFGGRERPLALGSVKSNIGHADAAAGIAGLIKTVLAIQRGVLPPSLHFSAPNPHIDFASARIGVVGAAQAWPDSGSRRRAGVSAFGIGGTNVHVVLEQAPVLASVTASVIDSASVAAPASAPATWSATSSDPAPQTLVLSARTPHSLQAAATALAAALESDPSLPLADVAFTLQQGRAAFAQRMALVAADCAAAAAALRRQAAEGAWHTAAKPAPKVALLFPGQGSQYPRMAQALYAADPVYRTWFDRCAELAAPHLGQDLRALLYGDASQQADAQALKQTRLAQPALFAVMFALAKSVMAQGIEAHTMLGHSLGEYVAACLAGVFELEDALQLVAARGRLMQSLPAGAMLAVQVSATEAAALLQSLPDCELSLAALNAAEQCVFAGTVPAIDALQAHLQGSGRAALRLETSHAFHSAMMQPILPAFMAQFAGLRLRAPTRRFISNVSGSWIDAAEATDPAYWARHLRQSVRFEEGLATLRAAGIGVLLELGPGNALRKLAGAAGWDAHSLPALQLRQHAPENPQALQEAVAQMWSAGVAVDWRAHDGALPKSPARRRVALPGYAFERRRHWPQATATTAPSPSAISQATATQAGAKRPDLADWFYLPGWQRAPRLAAAMPTASWLLFAGEGETQGQGLARALRAAGQQVVTVEAGGTAGEPAGLLKTAADRYRIDPASAQAYRRLLAELEAQPAARPTRIVHLWGSEAALAPQQALHGLMHLMQAIGAEGVVRPLKLDIVSSGLADITGAESLAPGAALLLGAAKIIPVEYRNVECRLIDVVAAEAASAMLLAELANPEAAPAVAIRRHHRWLPQLTPVRLPAPAPDRERLRPDAVVLITGAFGGMGASIARHLSQTRQSRLVLLGRRVDAELVAALEQNGSQVHAAACDVADAVALAREIDAARQRFGAIHAVFHAAGVADLGGVIQNRSMQSLDQALAAKVQGTLNLDRLLSDPGLDCMVLFSTLGGFLPQAKFGQVGYAAANEFLDAFAAERSLRTGQFTVAIDWDDWGEAGMTLAARERRGQPALSLQESMRTEEGLAVLQRILAAPHARVAVSIRDLPALMAEADSLFDASAAEGGSAAPLDDLAASGEGMTRTEALLAATWRQILGVAQIGPDANFFELGGHSLIAMRLLSFVRESFGVELNIAAVFEHATLAALAAHIDAAAAGKDDGDAAIEEFTI